MGGREGSQHACRQSCHSEGPRQAGGMNWQRPHKIQQTSAWPCPWEEKSPGNDTGWRGANWRTALQKRLRWATASSQYVLTAKTASGIPGCMKKSTYSRLGEAINPFYFATDYTVSRILRPALGINERQRWAGIRSAEGHWDGWGGLENWPVRRGWGSRACSAQRRNSFRAATACLLAPAGTSPRHPWELLRRGALQEESAAVVWDRRPS